MHRHSALLRVVSDGGEIRSGCGGRRAFEIFLAILGIVCYDVNIITSSIEYYIMRSVKHMEMTIQSRKKFQVKDPMSALTHLIGFLAVIPFFILLMRGAQTPRQQIGFLVFGISLLLLYGASTIYHTLRLSAERTALLRRIDHMMIFVLIAGTYTPICLVLLEGRFGTILLSLIWAIALAGILMKIFWMGAPRWLSTTIYVVMGWLSVTAIVPLLKCVGWGGFGLLLAGGIAYTVGAVIYALKKPNLPFLKSFGFHEIFHVFVMIGSGAHIAFMIVYVL